jgi:hypothetical protein
VPAAGRRQRRRRLKTVPLPDDEFPGSQSTNSATAGATGRSSTRARPSQVKHHLEVVLHAHDGPAAYLRLGHRLLRTSVVGELAPSVVVADPAGRTGPSAASRRPRRRSRPPAAACARSGPGRAPACPGRHRPAARCPWCGTPRRAGTPAWCPSRSPVAGGAVHLSRHHPDEVPAARSAGIDLELPSRQQVDQLPHRPVGEPGVGDGEDRMAGGIEGTRALLRASMTSPQRCVRGRKACSPVRRLLSC